MFIREIVSADILTNGMFKTIFFLSQNNFCTCSGTGGMWQLYWVHLL